MLSNTESILAPAELFKSRQVKVTSKGIIDLVDLKNKITQNTVLVSIMLVNNEIGTVQPLREASAIVKKELKARQKKGNKLPLYLHSDAAQAGNYLELKTSRLGVGLLALTGVKYMGPNKLARCLCVQE